MRILILSFYYPPDLSAGSFRAHALVQALRREGGTALEIQVMTTMPNRYQSHTVSAPASETLDGAHVRRLPLPAHQSGMLDQAKAFTAFARQALNATRGQRWDLVFATSSRLMTAVLGARIARRAGAPLYLDIRDLFIDTLSDVLNASALRHLLPVFRRLERWAFRSANRLNVVSAGFLSYVSSLAPAQTCRTFTNGIDDEFIEQDFRAVAPPGVLPLVVYAGNMGEGQGLHRIVPEAARLLQGEVRFRLIGDGGRRKALEDAVAGAALRNVEILDAVPRGALLEQYRAADVLFLHLNDYAAFRKVLPSKLFEYAATGKPVLAGVAGHSAEFLRSQVPGAAVFSPCEARQMVDALRTLLDNPTRHYDRAAFCQRFARSAIMQEMARDVLDLARAT